MTIIHCSCPICGDLELSPADIELTVWAGNTHQDRNHYQFTCPKCRDAVRKPADLEVVRLLTSGGVHITRIVVPAEADDPIRATARPITPDELLDLHIALAADTWVPDLKEFA